MYLLTDLLRYEPVARLVDTFLVSSRAATKLVAYYAAHHLVWRHYPTVSAALPVAGFDSAAAQDVFFRLQQCAVSDGSEEALLLPLQWLQTLQLCQIASVRLVDDMNSVERSIQFWEAQLTNGDLNMVLSNGPVACFKHAALALNLRRPGADDVSAFYNLQRKVQLLRAVRKLLAEALSFIFSAAGQLRLVVGSNSSLQGQLGQAPLSDATSPCSLAPLLNRDDDLLQAARLACDSCLTVLVSSITRLTDGVKVVRLNSYRATVQRAALERSDSLDQYSSEVRQAVDYAMQPDSGSGPSVDEGDEEVVPNKIGTQVLPALLAAAQQLLSVQCTPLGIVTIIDIDDDQSCKAGWSWSWINLPFCRVARVLSDLVPVSVFDPVVQLQSPRAPPAVQSSPSAASVQWPTAALALHSSNVAAARTGKLVSLPHWVKLPGRWKRYWLRFCILGAATAWGLKFLHIHSRLAGSDDLERWATHVADALRGTWQEHVVQPLVTVGDELFKTFRSRPSIVSAEEFADDKACLLRMLVDFQKDVGKASDVDSVAYASAATAASASTPLSLSQSEEEQLLVKGMRSVMESYETELKSPIRNLVSGLLARAMLIQVQRLKVDTEAAMLELDQILRANELSISVMAAVPALAVSWALLMLIGRRFMTKPSDVKKTAMPLRMAAARLERSLHRAQQAADGTSVPAEAQGMTVYHISKVYLEAVVLYSYHDQSSRFSEWPQLKADLLEVARIEADKPLFRLAVVERMMRTYSLFER